MSETITISDETLAKINDALRHYNINTNLIGQVYTPDELLGRLFDQINTFL